VIHTKRRDAERHASFVRTKVYHVMTALSRKLDYKILFSKSAITALQRLVILEGKEAEHQCHEHASQEKQSRKCDNPACDHRQPHGISCAIEGIILYEKVTRNIAAIERIDRQEVDQTPKEIRRYEYCGKHGHDRAAKWHG